MAISQGVLTHNFIDLSDCVVKDALERKSKLDRVKVINVMVSMRCKAVSARNHEAEIGVCIDDRRAKLVVSRPSMFALSNISSYMRTRKITMKCHVLSCNVVVQQGNNEAITEVARQGRLTVIE